MGTLAACNFLILTTGCYWEGNKSWKKGLNSQLLSSTMAQVSGKSQSGEMSPMMMMSWMHNPEQKLHKNPDVMNWNGCIHDRPQKSFCRELSWISVMLTIIMKQWGCSSQFYLLLWKWSEIRINFTRFGLMFSQFLIILSDAVRAKNGVMKKGRREALCVHMNWGIAQSAAKECKVLKRVALLV